MYTFVYITIVILFHFAHIGAKEFHWLILILPHKKKQTIEL